MVVQRLPKPRPTKSSELLCKAREGKPAEASAKLFVMKKFLKVTTTHHPLVLQG